MPKHWNLKPKISDSAAEALKVTHPLLAQLLHNRGITAAKEADAFLHPSYEKLFDPFKFRDMEKAVERIWHAVTRGDKVAIYADYDADAVTAAAVLTQTFRYLGIEVPTYIPDRFTEGYGVNLEALQQLQKDGVSVIVTVDCGTNSTDAAQYCRNAGIDFIITDHHEITGAVPQSFALINPKNPADHYPDNQITGVGVAYKLACALLSKAGKVQERLALRGEPYVPHWDKWLLDLVAIGTVADCHSLFGENRTLVSFGLKVLAKTKWLGLQLLLASVGNGKPAALDTYTIGFKLAPRINAAGRLEHASLALNLLLATDPVTAQQLVATLEQVNTRRQELTARIVSEAKAEAELQQGRKIILVSSPDWSKGVVGLAASRLAADLGKPAIVLEKGAEESTGSARSVGNFDIVAALQASSDSLVKFGGHKQAAGLTVKTAQLQNFYRNLLEYAETHLETFEPTLDLEAELGAEDITVELHDLVAQLEPFGVGNPKPRFLVTGAVVTTLRCVGSASEHLQMAISINGVPVESIGFNMAYLYDKISVGNKVDLAVELLANTWNGYRKIKLKLLDLKVAP